MGSDGKTRDSFGDNLSELEGLREDLEGMLDSAAGWEWVQKPSESRYSTKANGDVVAHWLRAVGPPNQDGSPGEPYVAITVAQRGADARLGRKCRPVAYDRHGQRHVFDGGSSSAIGGSYDSDDWVRASMHRLLPENLHEDDIALLGVEIDQRRETP